MFLMMPGEYEFLLSQDDVKFGTTINLIRRLDSRLRGMTTGGEGMKVGLVSGWRGNVALSVPHLLEARHEAAQGVGHKAARQADVDQLEAGFIPEGPVQGGV